VENIEESEPFKPPTLFIGPPPPPPPTTTEYEVPDVPVDVPVSMPPAPPPPPGLSLELCPPPPPPPATIKYSRARVDICAVPLLHPLDKYTFIKFVSVSKTVCPANGDAGFVLEVQIVTPLSVESSFACVTAFEAIFPVVTAFDAILPSVIVVAAIFPPVTARSSIFAVVTPKSVNWLVVINPPVISQKEPVQV
jgi:hypothetical protein